MRILMVTNTYAPAQNGVAMWASLSVRELRALGHEVTVLTYAHEGRVAESEGVVELPAWGGLDGDFRVGPVPSKLPLDASPGAWDVVHVHHPVLLGPAGVRLARETGAKVAFTCHSVYTDYADEYYFGIGRPLKPLIRRGIARFCNGIDLTFVPSSWTARWLRECGATGRIAMLDAPADLTRIRRATREDARAALGLGDRPVALYVGRIADEKRPDVLIREFVEVARHFPGAILAMAGTGVRAKAAAKQVETLRLGDQVRFLGSIGGEELGLWYSAADVCVSASRSETGPLTAVESMACGCPNVALRAPGFEDRIRDGENGLLVEDRPGSLGDAVMKVLGDPALRESLSRGASSFAEQYTPEANVRHMLAMYGEVGASLQDVTGALPALQEE